MVLRVGSFETQTENFIETQCGGVGVVLASVH